MALLVQLLLLTPAVVHVLGQPGFLSIDCGLDNQYAYTELETGISYVSDGSYVDAGENHKVAAEYDYDGVYTTVRSFPYGVRNCYTLPTETGAKYLVRLEALYGNHDGKNNGNIEFELHLGSNFWDTVLVTYGDVYEAVFTPWASWAPVCLVNTGHGTPFLSYLELRMLPDTLYPLVTAKQGLNTYMRINMGGAFIRFPEDPYDRRWLGTTSDDPNSADIITTDQIIRQDQSYMEPQGVLRTAVVATGINTTISYYWWQARKAYSFMVLLHFADLRNTGQVRQFDIYFGANLPSLNNEPYSPLYLASSSVYSNGWYTSTNDMYSITLNATAASELPPICNAIEIYTQLPLNRTATFPKDFDAIMAIKLEYGVKKNWMGDPCFPTKYLWDGVKCSDASNSTMRITSLDLSNSLLHGAISMNFTLLTALENLDLSYNNLSGPIPDSLSRLPSLRVVNLAGNDLSDDDPICKNYNGPIVFRCNEAPGSSESKATVIAISVVVPVVVVVVLLAYFIWRKKGKLNVSKHDAARDPPLDNAPGIRKGHDGHLPNTENCLFTYKDLEKFTNNFRQVIGQGGFGLVYYGQLEDTTEIAVKMRSESSSQGIDNFLAEVQSLTKVHHRNLVSLIGYCLEKGHEALVYEYMSEGSLFYHVRGKYGGARTLNWRTRVQVVLEAAQGLDYLHKGCSPPIIHRDVKSSNILLGKNLQAKIADLGLSRIYLNDNQTHVSATAAGTTGYMDPEYYLTGRLNESSDVFSFGVVLLEVATGEPPLLPGHGHIMQRVRQKIFTDDISSIADPRLGAAFDINSMWKVVDTAMMCTAEAAAQRPTMATVVAHLKESLAMEEARNNMNIWGTATPESYFEGSVSTSGPSAR